MSERSSSLLLRDVLEAIKNIQSFTKDITLDQYLADLKTRHAVERNFSIIGEAVARLDNSLKEQHPNINWRQVKDFRNLIIHDYFGIDDTIVWDIIQFDLGQLQADIQELIKKGEEEN
jgi:uncharacterized protein with HEPN domain